MLTQKNYMKLEFPARSVNEGFARAAVAAFAAQLDPTLAEIGDIKTAVSEAVTNAVVHAYPDKLGTVQVRVRILPDERLEIAVKDHGIGIADVAQARTPLYTTGGEERSGMGFTIMESFMDTLRVKSVPGRGTTVTMCRRIRRRMIAEETRDLLRRAQAGDAAAAEQMVTENTGLIWSVARRFFGRGVEPDDLYQLGCVGFLKAMQGFDEQYGTCFSTYAVPKISGEIRRFLRDDGAVKVSRSIKERAQGIRTARTRLEQTLGREPTLSELAAETGLEPEEIAAAETATGPTESLQKENGETGFTLEHTLGDYDQEERMVEYAALREALCQLPERERQVIALRFYHGLTQQRAAGILHISQVQVSRLERRAVERLREWLAT